MHITSMTVTLSETVPTEPYGSTKPSISVTAALDATDDPHAVLQTLLATAASGIQPHIDAELMHSHKPPRYYTGQRYKALRVASDQVVLIIPTEIGVPEPIRTYSVIHGMPLEQTITETLDHYAEHELLVCTTVEEWQPVFQRLVAAQHQRDHAQQRQREDQQRAWMEAQRHHDAQQATDADDDDIDELDEDDADER